MEQELWEIVQNAAILTAASGAVVAAQSLVMHAPRIKSTLDKRCVALTQHAYWNKSPEEGLSRPAGLYCALFRWNKYKQHIPEHTQKELQYIL